MSKTNERTNKQQLIKPQKFKSLAKTQNLYRAKR